MLTFAIIMLQNIKYMAGRASDWSMHQTRGFYDGTKRPQCVRHRHVTSVRNY